MTKSIGMKVVAKVMFGVGQAFIISGMLLFMISPAVWSTVGVIVGGLGAVVGASMMQTAMEGD